MPDSEVISAVKALQDATNHSRDNHLSIELWGSSLGQVSFKDASGVAHSARTLQQIDIDSAESAAVAEQAWALAVSDIEIKDKAAYKGAVESASGGKNSVFWDAQNNPNVMVWINRFNSEDVNAAILAKHGVDLELGTGVFPAFVKGGVEMRGFWYPKYQASNGATGGCGVVAGLQPKTSVNYDQAKAFCTNKGPGWHLASNLEWAAVSYLSMAFGAEVRGNTNYGRSHEEKHETGRRGDLLSPGDTAGTARTDCGSGPASWSHDGTQHGIFDLVGNVWEWVDGLLLKEGRIIAPLDNNPDIAESDWTTHDTCLDASVVTGGSVVLSNTVENRVGALGDSSNSGNTSSNDWASTAKHLNYVDNLLMRQMAIESASTTNLAGRIYARNFGERAPLRGGYWNNGSIAGRGALSFYNSRTNANSSIGFRPALFES